jgi:hypothetical protein
MKTRNTIAPAPIFTKLPQSSLTQRRRSERTQRLDYRAQLSEDDDDASSGRDKRTRQRPTNDSNSSSDKCFDVSPSLSSNSSDSEDSNLLEEEDSKEQSLDRSSLSREIAEANITGLRELSKSKHTLKAFVTASGRSQGVVALML